MKAGWTKATSIKPANTKILKKELEKERYSVIVKAVEIGARGFVAGTQYQFLNQIRIKGRNRAKCIKHLIEITENSSVWIWNKRNIPWNNSKWSSLNRPAEDARKSWCREQTNSRQGRLWQGRAINRTGTTSDWDVLAPGKSEQRWGDQDDPSFNSVAFGSGNGWNREAPAS